MRILRYLLFFIILFSTHFLFAQGIRGVIKDLATGAVISGASIIVPETTIGTQSNEKGAYFLKLENGNYRIKINFVGYETVTKEITVSGQTIFNVNLHSSDASLNEVIVVGSRSAVNLSKMNTPVPVDVIPVSRVTNTQGQVDLNQLLQFISPSFNTNRQTGSDGADHVDPASLRGLGPDQTLVLINGKRLHQSSLVTIFGTRGRGNTGTDLNTIPASSIERIEVLRDGAAAQYGSDAIAGVINIVLKQSNHEFNAGLSTGISDKGDGQELGFSANKGFSIAKKGFLNITADYLHRDRTNRAVYNSDETIEVRRHFGDPLNNSYSGVLNFALPVSKSFTVYANAIYNFRYGNSFAFTRYADDPNNVPSIYPNGFDPKIVTHINDISLTGGIKGKVLGFDMDLSNTYGKNRFHYFVQNTLNASLLDKSPLSFDAGGFQLQQNTVNLDFTKFYKGALSGINLAFGAEYRSENYLIFAGEPGSYTNYGGFTTAPDPTKPGVTDTTFKGSGSQGYPGYQPRDVTNHSRSNTAVYADGEIHFSKNWMTDFAARYEHYSDFGSTLNGKFATRYEFIPGYALRGSVSTGFRAPSLAQEYFNSTYSNVVQGKLIATQLANNANPLVQALGVQPLKQEKSVNLSLGFTAHPVTGFDFTLDAYYIKIKDRIVLSGDFTPTNSPAIADQLANYGVQDLKFFANAVDTKTLGLDAVINYSTVIGNNNFNASLAANFNHLTFGAIKAPASLGSEKDTLFSVREQAFVKASAPPSKYIFMVNDRLGKFNFNIKLVRFGHTQLIDYNGPSQIYPHQITTDFSAGFHITQGFQVIAGVENIFNKYPRAFANAGLNESGGIYDPLQQGSMGRYYFVKMQLRF